MRIISRTLITKGILGFKKVWSITSRGILDRLMGSERAFGHPEASPEELEWTFYAEGRKLFEREVEIVFCGKKAYEQERELEVVGQWSDRATAVFAIEAKKLFDEKIYTYAIARRQIEILEAFQLQGKKLKDIEVSSGLVASISKRVSCELELSSQKSIAEKETCTIQGGKEINFAKTTLILGKKDISPIFLALDD